MLWSYVCRTQWNHILWSGWGTDVVKLRIPNTVKSYTLVRLGCRYCDVTYAEHSEIIHFGQVGVQMLWSYVCRTQWNHTLWVGWGIDFCVILVKLRVPNTVKSNTLVILQRLIPKCLWEGYLAAPVFLVLNDGKSPLRRSSFLYQRIDFFGSGRTWALLKVLKSMWSVMIWIE